MNVTLDEFLLNVRVADALDVLILSAVIYLVWRWLQRRATHAVAAALLGLGALYAVSKAFNLYLTAAVFQAGLTVMLFAVVVIFQDDLRHAAERIFTWRPFAPRLQSPPGEHCVQALVETVSLLGKEKVGALIVLPGRQPLERHIRGGVSVDGLVSVELLHSIFHPGSQGHDGAIIVRNERVELLGVHLPLSDNLTVIGNRGTRHTSALGLSERTDAEVIVVSEERGTIVLAQGDALLDIETPAELKNHLLSFFARRSSGSSAPVSNSARLKKLGAQLVSLIIAVVLWFVFAFRIETVQRSIESVPVEFRNVPEEWVIADTAPNNVELTLVGPERAFASLNPAELKVAVDIQNLSDDQTSAPIREEYLDLPEDIHLREAVPATLRFRLRRMATFTLPVKVNTEGRLPAGITLVGTKPQPTKLNVQGPSQQRERYSGLQTEAINLSEIRESTTVTVPLRFPRGIQPLGEGGTNVRVRIEVRREPGGASPTKNQAEP